MDRYTALAQFLAENQQRPFAWGKWDCCLFAAGAVQVQTGIDYAADYRGRYTTALGAKRILTRFGHSDIRSAISEQLGEPVAAPLCQRGDVVLVGHAENTVAGIVFGTHVWVIDTHGMMQLGTAHAQCGWRVR